MADTFDPYPDLDMILKELGTPKTYGDLKITFPDNPIPAFNHARLEQGVEKLRDDGYVYVVNKPNYVTETELQDGWYVRRSYKGEMLVLAGGYVKHHLMMEARQKNEILRQIAVIVGTLVAGLGAIGLVVWEMYAFYHEKICH
jgi:hypothetical protein